MACGRGIILKMGPDGFSDDFGDGDIPTLRGVNVLLKLFVKRVGNRETAISCARHGLLKRDFSFLNVVKKQKDCSI